MQILALVTEAFGSRGGIQEFNRHWLRALAAGPASQIEVLATAGPVWREGLISQQSVSGKLAYFAAAGKLASANPGLILCGHLSLLPLAGWLAARRGIPLWLQLHGIEAWQRPVRKLRRGGLDSVTLVSAVSRYTRRRFLAWANMDEHQVRILPNTLADDCFAPAGAAGRGGNLLTVGRLSAAEGYKGQDAVIQALPQVRRHHPDTGYVIVGDGDDLPRLKTLAQDCGVADAVEFKTGLDRTALLEAYQHARLFVLPSTGEGFGIVFLEALACGCPVLGLGSDGSADPLSIKGGTFIAGENLAQSIIEALDETQNSGPDPASVRQKFGLPIFQSQVNVLALEATGQ